MAITEYVLPSELDTEQTSPDPSELEYRVEVSDDGVLWELAALTDDLDMAMELFAKKTKRYFASIQSIPKGSSV